MAAALIYLDGQWIVLRAALACAIHEFGHGAAIKAFGGRIRALSLTAIGAAMIPEYSRPLSYRQDILVAAAGPIANVLVAGMSILSGWYLFAGFNLCFGLLNLFPIHALDGGRVLTALLNAFWPQWGERASYIVSTVLSGLLLGLGMAAWNEWGNLTLLITALWLVVDTIKT